MPVNTLVLFVIGVISSLIGIGLLGVLAFFVGKRLFRTIVQHLFNLVMGRLLEDDYAENLMELWSAVRRTSVQNILEISLRAQTGEIIKRPLGTYRKLNHFDNLMFVPAQLARLPIEPTVPVDMKVKLGSRAERPLVLDVPIFVAGMGYGVALSEEAKIALAKGARAAGTAINSGEGPYLHEERQAAGKYIWQISRSNYGRNPQALAAADMIEVQMGQGARMGGHIEKAEKLAGKAQKLMGVAPNVSELIFGAVIPGVATPWDWPKYVADLRREIGGKPLCIKIMAGGRLEADLAVAIEAGFDVISIEGAQGGTAGASPTITDDFGIPSINALVRSQRYLVEQGVRKEVSLIVSGGYMTPGQCLKAIALGADAIALGTVPLFALVHKQLAEVLPWEPLTQLVWYDSKYKHRLDINLATKSVENVLKAFALEMEEGVRAVGKTSLSELGPNDLVALDDWTAELTGVAKV